MRALFCAGRVHKSPATGFRLPRFRFQVHLSIGDDELLCKLMALTQIAKSQSDETLSRGHEIVCGIAKAMVKIARVSGWRTCVSGVPRANVLRNNFACWLQQDRRAASQFPHVIEKHVAWRAAGVLTSEHRRVGYSMISGQQLAFWMMASLVLLQAFSSHRSTTWP